MVKSRFWQKDELCIIYFSKFAKYQECSFLDFKNDFKQNVSVKVSYSSVD